MWKGKFPGPLLFFLKLNIQKTDQKLVNVEASQMYDCQRKGSGTFKFLRYPDVCRRMTSTVFRRICLEVFEDVDKVRLMMRGYYAYTPHGTEDYYSGTDSWSRTMKVAKVRYQEQVLLPPSAWGVLNKRVYESSVCFEDFRRVNNHNEDVKLQPSATITRDLRRRLYGILHFENRKTKPFIREWCAENTESYVKTVKVRPTFPPVPHPGLRALWNAKRKETLAPIKWKLFLWGVSPSITNTAEWISLPPDLVLSTATCYYLYHEKNFVTKDESKAILVTLAMVSDSNKVNLDPIRKTKKVVRNFRATQISVTFSRAYSLVFALMESLGFASKEKAYITHIKFEPLLFNLMHKKVTERASNLKDMCETNLDVLKNLRKMEDIIFGGQLIM